MSAIIVLHGGERVKVAGDYQSIVSSLVSAGVGFRDFPTEDTYPGGSRIAVNVEAVVAVIDA